jgi:hypothetical protein
MPFSMSSSVKCDHRMPVTDLCQKGSQCALHFACIIDLLVNRIYTFLHLELPRNRIKVFCDRTTKVSAKPRVTSVQDLTFELWFRPVYL